MRPLNMRTTAIIPAAGGGLRLQANISKPLILIGGIPIIIYALKAITEHPYIKEAVIVANPSNIHSIRLGLKEYRIKKVEHIVMGGATRRLSVENGLKYAHRGCEFILIHDAARPFIKKELITKVIKRAQQCGAAAAGVPVKATIKRAAGPSGCRGAGKFIVQETIDRQGLWEIQTPQVFKKELILEAYKRFKDRDASDDSVLVERLGVRVGLVEGSYYNIKITTGEDLLLAQAIAANSICLTASA